MNIGMQWYFFKIFMLWLLMKLNIFLYVYWLFTEFLICEPFALLPIFLMWLSFIIDSQELLIYFWYYSFVCCMCCKYVVLLYGVLINNLLQSNLYIFPFMIFVLYNVKEIFPSPWCHEDILLYYLLKVLQLKFHIYTLLPHYR